MLFLNCTSLRSLGFAKVKTSGVEDAVSLKLELDKLLGFEFPFEEEVRTQQVKIMENVHNLDVPTIKVTKRTLNPSQIKRINYKRNNASFDPKMKGIYQKLLMGTEVF